MCWMKKKKTQRERERDRDRESTFHSNANANIFSLLCLVPRGSKLHTKRPAQRSHSSHRAKGQSVCVWVSQKRTKCVFEFWSTWASHDSLIQEVRGRDGGVRMKWWWEGEMTGWWVIIVHSGADQSVHWLSIGALSEMFKGWFWLYSCHGASSLYEKTMNEHQWAETLHWESLHSSTWQTPGMGFIQVNSK